MSEITSLDFMWKENTVWFNDTDSSIDYFHHSSGSLKYIMELILKYGADKIEVTVTNNDATIPAQRRINQICKKCGYEATEKSHMHTYNNGYECMVYEWDLVKVKEMPKPAEPEHIYDTNTRFEVGDVIQNKYGDRFQVKTTSDRMGYQSITFSKLMKNGKVCKRQYSNSSAEYRKIE